MNQSSATSCLHREPPAGRRGVLLLVVLSMLTLFLMLGAAYVVTATRSREAARAYARLTFGSDDARVPHARLLDAVLLSVVRGPVVIGSGTFESLLLDKYGPGTVSGTVTGVSVLNGHVATCTLATEVDVRPASLNGCILTFVEPGRRVTSHRIIRARNSDNDNALSGGPATIAPLDVAFDLPADKGPYVLSGTMAVIINGREYSGASGTSPEPNESWDGFDDANPFLARVAPATVVSSATNVRFSYASAAGGDSYDNDNDGVADGRFMQFRVLPTTVTDAFGNAVTLEASVLIVDLDGRFNVNAHGSLTPTFYPPSHERWPTANDLGSSGSLDQVPLGSGYGPGDLHANLGTGINPTSPNPTATSGSTPFQASPRVFDAPYLASGIDWTLTVTSSLAVPGQTENPRFLLMTGGATFSGTVPIPMPRGRKPPGSRHPRFFTDTGNPTNTPRLRFAEGRYGDWAAINWSGTSLATDTAVGKPGAPLADDAASTIGDRRVANVANTGTNYGIPAIWWDGSANYNWSLSSLTSGPRGVFNSPPDLHGRMKTLTLSGSGSAIVPRMVFAQPEWGNATQDDPYEFRLDTRRGFGGMLHNPDPTTGAAADNPFTLAELDAVLRPYDIDTFRRPPRLVAALGSTAEESRLKVTTDSWDTTAITGSAAIAIFGTNASSGGTNGWLSRVPTGLTFYVGNPTSGVIGGEVSRGERFDLNRALATGVTGTNDPNWLVQRRAYFKDLYTLLVALHEGSSQTLSATDAAALAQWAANVVEFRDADSTCTMFEYDTIPRNGWTATSGTERRVVWGAERPEIVIADTLAWENVDSGTTGGLFITLHRPWSAMAHARSGTLPTDATMIPAEPCDLAFDTRTSGSTGRPRNEVDLGKKAGVATRSGTNPLYDNVSNTQWPIWRLRIVGGGTTEYVRLDMGTNATAGTTGRAFGVEALSTSGSLGDKKPKLAADSTLTLRGSTALRWATSSTTGTLTVSVSGSSCAISGASGSLRVPGPVVTGSAFRTAVIHLERLADPTGTATQQVWDADQSPLATGTGTLAQRYLVVDSSTVTVWNTGTTGRPGVTSHTLRGTRRAVGVAEQAFWRPPSEDSGTITISPPAAPVPASPSFPNLVTGASATNVAWFPWPNRPFVSAAELLLVPQGSAVEILQNYRRLTPTQSGSISLGQGVPIPLSLLFDAVHVPTRFAGIHASGTWTTGTVGGAGTVGGEHVGFNRQAFTANQVSAFREPGRVNLNTVTSEDVWNAVVAGPLPAAVKTMTSFQSSFISGTGARSMGHLLALSASGASPTTEADTNTNPDLSADRNPLHAIYTATRLANTTTPRSNLFAIWITLRESVAGDPDSVRYRRAFYIVDRSIPVGFREGLDYNVWDAVRLRRIIE
jgi:hypothetical protein